METKGFFASLFDYSFSSFITPRIIKVLYALTTLVLALWTLADILLAFRVSSALGVLALIFGPLMFVIAMIYTRVVLELLIAFFRMHEDVEEINAVAGRAAGTGPAPPRPEAGPAVAPA
jgi:hypothetical protein